MTFWKAKLKMKYKHFGFWDVFIEVCLVFPRSKEMQLKLTPLIGLVELSKAVHLSKPIKYKAQNFINHNQNS